MNPRRRYRGSCHCGAVRIQFETGRPVAPRACQCSFCRRHGARSVSDAKGAATLAFAAKPVLYRFASRTADYILCSVCGVYVGAMTGEAEARRVTLNLNNFDHPRAELGAVPVSYDGESAEARAASRLSRWTPLRIER